MAEALNEGVSVGLSVPVIELLAQGEGDGDGENDTEAVVDSVPDPDSVGERDWDKVTVAQAEEHAEGVPVVLPLKEPEWVLEWEEVTLWERQLEAVTDTVPQEDSVGEEEGEMEMVGHAVAVAETVPVVLSLREPENVPEWEGVPLWERQPVAVIDVVADTVVENESEGEALAVGHAEGVRETLPELLPLREPENVADRDGDPLTVDEGERVVETVEVRLRETVGELVNEEEGGVDPVRLLQPVAVDEALAQTEGDAFPDDERDAVTVTLNEEGFEGVNVRLLQPLAVDEALAQTVVEAVFEKVREGEAEVQPLGEVVNRPVVEKALEGELVTLPVGINDGEADADAQTVPELEVHGVAVPLAVAELETVRWEVCVDVVLAVPLNVEEDDAEEQDVADAVSVVALDCEEVPLELLLPLAVDEPV